MTTISRVTYTETNQYTDTNIAHLSSTLLKGKSPQELAEIHKDPYNIYTEKTQKDALKELEHREKTIMNKLSDSGLSPASKSRLEVQLTETKLAIVGIKKEAKANG